MARIQILGLPEGTADEGPPFILVIDQYQPQRYALGLGAGQKVPVDPWEGLAEKVGARAVLTFQETIEIPANETPVGPDGYPLFRVGGDEQLREQVRQEIAKAHGDLTHFLLQE